MAERWIIDASPLIVLAKIGHASLLEELSAEVLVPETVAQEVLQGASEDPARRALETGFGSRTRPRELSQRVLAWSLGPGETEVLSLALERQDATVVVDDQAARRCARALHLRMIGTLGVVVRAKRRGRITSAADVFRSLRDAGFHVDEATLLAVLQQVEPADS